MLACGVSVLVALDCGVLEAGVLTRFGVNADDEDTEEGVLPGIVADEMIEFGVLRRFGVMLTLVMEFGVAPGVHDEEKILLGVCFELLMKVNWSDSSSSCVCKLLFSFWRLETALRIDCWMLRCGLISSISQRLRVNSSKV